MSTAKPRVAVVMGSDSDWSVMHDAAIALAEFGVEVEVEVLSAHRTPDKMITFGRAAASRGIGVIIAGAGGAAHLPGMIAAVTTLPVIGVPVPLARLDGLDSLLSIVQMPAGVPVATVSIGGARNAGLLAVRILSVADASLASQLSDFAASLETLVESKNAALKAKYVAGLSASTDSAANPTEANSADANPVDANPVDANPADANSADANPTGANSADANPVDANPATAETAASDKPTS